MRSTIVHLLAAPGRRLVPLGHRLRPRAVPLTLVAGAYALALLQRPGAVIADTSLHLHVDPGGFVSDVAAAWTPTAGLGRVWAGDVTGLLFPMGPFFAAGDALGLPEWVVHRLWLGTLLAAAAYGVVRLLRVLVPAVAGRTGYGVLHLAGGGLYVVNPYVAVSADRTSVVLLAYAALPWMLLCVHRGLRDPHGWWWPGAFALVLTSTGAGVDGATVVWVLLAAGLLVAYEVGWGGVPRAALRPWLGRLTLTSAVVCAWWVVPMLVQAQHGFDALAFAVQPETIWSTTSLAESFRLLGQWTSYVGVGFGGELRPFASHGPAFLFALPVVLAGMAVPALVILGLRWSWRARYAPYFLLLLVAGLLVMAVGFPPDTPLRRAANAAYDEVEALRFLRTTYQAGPLVALALAALGGLGSAGAWRASARRPRLRAFGALAATAVVALAAWPLTSGRAPDRQLAFEVPSSWQQVADRLDGADPNTRAVVFPGQLVGAYLWGQTVDAVLPVLTDHPVVTRTGMPAADLRATELQWSVDALVGEERLLPGQLAPLLDLLGVGQVVLATDGDRARSGELGPAEVARVLGEQPDATGGGLAAGGLADPGLRAPEIDPQLGGGALPGTTPSGIRRESFGTPALLPAAAGRLSGPVRLAPLELRPSRTGGIVRLVPRAPVTVVDGGAQGILDLAAFGDLRPDRPLAYAPDLDREALSAAVRDGGGFVIADGARRRAFVPSRLRGNTGPTVPADRDVGEAGTRLDPFAADGDRPQAQTVAVLRGRGATAISAPSDPRGAQFPEHRPAAALDGDLSTSWLADRDLDEDRRYLEVTFPEPRDVGTIELHPYSDGRGTVRAVEVNGRRLVVRPGWNTLRVGLDDVSRLRVRIAEVTRPQRASAGAGGIRELRIPGVEVRETLRPPTVLEDALRQEDLSSSPLTYLLQRTTADAPAFRGRLSGPAQAGLLRDAQDPEPRLERSIRPPTARRYISEAWVSVDPAAADDTLDELVAPAAAVLRARSASRFEGRPRHRASGAFDGGTDRAWIGQWIGGRPAWLSWRTPQTTTLERLRLVPPAVRVRRPTRVRLRSEEGVSAPVAVRADGFVRLSTPLRGRAFRLEILDAAFAPGTPERLRRRRAVGIGELRGAGVEPVRAPRSGRAGAPCGAVVLRAAGRTLRLRVPDQDLRRFDAGLPLRAEGCTGISLPAARTLLRDTGTGTFRADRLRLFSAPPGGLALPGAGGEVLAPGNPGNGTRRGVRLDVREPSWLVYGEAFAAGWTARCDGRDLGEPVPLQGYANAWPVEPGCERVDITYGPQSRLTAGYVVSGAGVLLLLAFLLLRRRERVRQREPATAPPDVLDARADAPGRMRLVWAVASGLVAGGVLGGVVGLIPGAVTGPLLALILWRGIPNRLLVIAAGVLLLVGVPGAHLASGAEDRGGFDPDHALEHLAAHWVAAAALALLLVALVRWLAADLRLRRP